MAGLNYANKNPSCTYSNSDLAQGYGGAVSVSMCVAYSLRKMTAPIQKNATGKKLVLLNTFVGAISSACASYANTSLMRQAEVKTGIEVF